MKTTFCPISNKKINENVARGNAIQTVILLVIFALTLSPIVIGFLFIDFLLRGLELSKYSILATLSKRANFLFIIKPHVINAGPKIFAARIVLLFSAIIFVSTLLGWNIIALVFAGIFGFCAFLEGFFAFCIACEIYPFVYKLFYKEEVYS